MREPVDPDNLPEGTLVHGWKVVRRLDGGAYGTVYLVELDGKRYALKLARFLGHSGDKRRTDERAQRELSCLLLLRHRHIVQPRSYGRWPDPQTDFFFVVMDYVDGSTLAEWVERTHPTPHELVVLFDKLFSAVASAHAQGIFHRDLKPNNILVEGKTGEPVVVDFGAAFFPLPAEPRLTDTRLPPGTPRYTSPEALRFENVHRRDPEMHYEFKAADELYALGVTLFDLLTDPLHHSRPRPQPLGGWDTPRAHEVNSRVPALLSQFAARLLQSEPGKRPVSVEAARRELAELLPLQGAEWTQRPVHTPVPLPSAEGEAAPLHNTALGSQAPAEPVEPQPVEPDKPLPPEAHFQPPEVIPPPAAAPAEPQTSAQLSTVAPAVLTPAPTAPPRPRRVGRAAVGAWVLGLLVAAAALSVRPGAPEEPAPAPLSCEPTAPLSTPPEASAPTAASTTGEEPPAPPPVPPPISTPEKGTPVNIRPPAQPATASVCSQKQPPPRDTPAWLKWCKCTALAGSLVASQAGCPGAQIRQSLTEQCRPESVQAMQALGIDLHQNDIDVEMDMKQPSNGKVACGEDASGKVPIACIAEGPLTSRVVGGEGKGKLARGTLLSGYAWLHQVDSIRGKLPLYRWTEATLPDGSKHPVCIEDAGDDRTCPNGAARECAALSATAVRSFRPVKLDR